MIMNDKLPKIIFSFIKKVLLNKKNKFKIKQTLSFNKKKIK